MYEAVDKAHCNDCDGDNNDIIMMMMMMTITIMMCNEFQIIDPRWQHRLIFITRLAALAKMVAPVMMMTMMMMVMMVMIVIMKKHTNKISTDTLSAHRQKYNITRFTKDSLNIYIGWAAVRG